MHIYMKRLKISVSRTGPTELPDATPSFHTFPAEVDDPWPVCQLQHLVYLIGNPVFTMPLTFAGNVWKDGDASGSSVGPVLETVINTIYLKIIYLLNIYIISLSGDWLLYKGMIFIKNLKGGQ
jgi:hypothetical protein